jgi:hypothetical protein
LVIKRTVVVVVVVVIIIIILMALQPTVGFSLPPHSGGFLDHTQR